MSARRRTGPLRSLVWMSLAAAVCVTLVLAGVRSHLASAAAPGRGSGTVVVYSPHPDDETFAMGSTIVTLVRSGRRVVCVLVTDGEGSCIVPAWIERGGVDLDSDGDVDRWDFATARRREDMRAMRELGVCESVCLGAAASHGRDGNRDGALDAAALTRQFERTVAPLGTSEHLTVMGSVPLDLYLTDVWASPEHQPVFLAVRALAASRTERATYFKDYVYALPRFARLAPATFEASPGSFAAKRRAIDIYRIGRQTTPVLWHGCREDATEYAVGGAAF